VKEFCIHPDLLCDGINHCSDGSDESSAANCQSEINSSFFFVSNYKLKLIIFFTIIDPTEGQIFGVGLTWVVLIAVCSMLLIFACLVGIAICICRRNQPSNGTNNGNIQSNNGNFNQVPRE
jgi:hypothetical protein